MKHRNELEEWGISVKQRLRRFEFAPSTPETPTRSQSQQNSQVEMPTPSTPKRKREEWAENVMKKLKLFEQGEETHSILDKTKTRRWSVGAPGGGGPPGATMATGGGARLPLPQCLQPNIHKLTKRRPMERPDMKQKQKQKQQM